MSLERRTLARRHTYDLFLSEDEHIVEFFLVTAREHL